MKGKGCIHCNVKPSGGWNLPRGRMKSETIQYIIEYWAKHGAKTVAPYINGEPLLEGRLPWICDLCQKNNMVVYIDTNATFYANKRNLVHPALREVRFTFSAVTPETYEKVHGAPLYHEAYKTIQWFMDNKLTGQIPILYFITNRFNIHEIPEYLEQWAGKIHIVLFPLHEVPDIQLESEKTKPTAKNYWNKVTRDLTGQEPKQPFRPIDVHLNGQKTIRHFLSYVTCQGTHSFSVAWNGLALHCTDIPYKYNYGHIYETDMLEVWHERNKAKLGHPACQVCNVKNPDHDMILKKYISDA